MMRYLLILISLSAMSCASTRVAMHEKFWPGNKPSYEDYFDTYIFGFVGDNELNLSSVCMDQKIYGFHRFHSLTDGILAYITLGMYIPMTVQVWCGD